MKRALSPIRPQPSQPFCPDLSEVGHRQRKDPGGGGAGVSRVFRALSARGDQHHLYRKSHDQSCGQNRLFFSSAYYLVPTSKRDSKG